VKRACGNEDDAAEHAADRRELALAREEDDYVAWEDVKVELGLD